MAKMLNKKIKGITQNWYIKALHCKAENKGTSVATYGYFIDSTAAHDRQNAVELQNISFTAVPDIDIFKQAYEVMAILPEFESAKDC